MGWLCSVHGRDEKWEQNFDQKTWREEYLEDLDVDEDNIYMNLRENGLDGVDWIHLAQDRDH